MAEFRSIHSKIWDDEWFSSLDYDGKVFFIYLITNRRASAAGIYRLPERVASAESGIPLDRIRELYKQFSEDGKAFTEKDIVWVAKLRKYQDTGSDTVAKRIKKDIDEIPDCELKRRYLAYYIPSQFSIDTVSIPYPQNMHDTDTDTDIDTDIDTDTCASAKKKQNTTPSAESLPDSRINALKEHYLTKHQEKFGEKPTVFAHAQAGRFFKVALKKHTEDEIKTRIDIFFSQSQKSYTFRYFQALYDELRQVKNNGRQPTIANSTRW